MLFEFVGSLNVSCSCFQTQNTLSASSHHIQGKYSGKIAFISCPFFQEIPAVFLVDPARYLCVTVTMNLTDSLHAWFFQRSPVKQNKTTKHSMFPHCEHPFYHVSVLTFWKLLSYCWWRQCRSKLICFMLIQADLLFLLSILFLEKKHIFVFGNLASKHKAFKLFQTFSRCGTPLKLLLLYFPDSVVVSLNVPWAWITTR